MELSKMEKVRQMSMKRFENKMIFVLVGSVIFFLLSGIFYSGSVLALGETNFSDCPAVTGAQVPAGYRYLGWLQQVGGCILIVGDSFNTSNNVIIGDEYLFGVPVKVKVQLNIGGWYSATNCTAYLGALGGSWGTLGACPAAASTIYDLKDDESESSFTILKSSINDIYTSADGATFGSWNTAPSTLVYGGSSPSIQDLTISSYGPYIVGQTLYYSLNFVNEPYNIYNVYFYEDIEETAPTRVVNNVNLGTSTGMTISHTFSFAGDYRPYVRLASSGCTGVTFTGGLIGCGSIVVNSSATLTINTQSTLASNLDARYGSIFSTNKTTDVIVGQSQYWTYDLNSNICTYDGSSVTSRRLYLGFPQDLAYADSGSTLAANSGILNRSFSRTAAPYSDFFAPYIKVFCANSTSFIVYLGGSLNKSQAQLVSVYDANDVRFAMPAQWFNGGGTINYGAGSGTLFQSDKHVYQPGEPVKLRWVFNTELVVTQLEVYSDTGSSTPLAVFTGATAIRENVSHYGTISYAKEGQYQPWILLKTAGFNPADNTTFDFFFLGGKRVTNPDYEIFVTKERSLLYTNSGAILGTFMGTGANFMVNDTNFDGVFNLDVMHFAGLGNTGNEILDAAGFILVPAVNGMIFIANKAYVVIKQSAMGSLVFAVGHPAAGSCYVTPSKIFGGDLPTAYRNKSFCVSYAHEPNSENITYVVKLSFIVMFLLWILKKIFIH